MSPLVNTFAGSPLDRAAERRGDADWLAERLEDGRTEVVLFHEGRPLITADSTRLVRIDVPVALELGDGAEALLFLGVRDGAAVFAASAEGGAEPSLPGLGQFEGLREVAANLDPGEAAIAASAKAIFDWRTRHPFCSACGQRTENADAGWKRVCPACRTSHFPRTDAVTIMLPVRGDQCLLGRQAAWPPGRYSALAGFVEPGESLEEACAREVWEEAGLRVTSARYHSSQPWPFPTNLMIGLIAEVAEGEARPDQTELEAVRWLTRIEARDLLAGRLAPALHPPPPVAIAYQLIRSWAYGEA